MSDNAGLSDLVDVELTPAQYETILHNVHDAVYTLDAEGRITWLNEVAFEEFDVGYTRDELVGSYVAKILSQEDIQKCVELITDLLHSEDRESARTEISIQTASGRKIPCDLHLALLPEVNGEFQGTVGVLRDITDQKRREQGLQVLNRVLRHNLRNNLNVVQGQVAHLEEQLSDDVQEHLDAINRATAELLRLSEKDRRVAEVLMAEDWPLEPIDAVEVVERRCDSLRARFPEAAITTNTLPKAEVTANQSLAFVIDQLIENAIEHSDRLSPTIDVAVERAPDNDDMIEIRVADEGVPIPEHEIEPLERERETALNHGSGLGLWVMKWVVDRCGGELAFEDRSPRGNVVVVRLQTAHSG